MMSFKLLGKYLIYFISNLPVIRFLITEDNTLSAQTSYDESDIFSEQLLNRENHDEKK